jgi:3-keto-5-aminohexanoate cleavage enzyme
VIWDELPVVVTVAPVGAEVTREDNPALPHTPAEIAADVVACAEAGASVCHLHVREEDGSPSSRPDLFVEAIHLIRQRSPIVTMVSTGGAVWMPMEERMTGLEARPDLAGVETGSMNFGEDPFVTVPADARRVVERAGELGIGLEAEMFDVGHVVAAVRMVERGELPPPLRANLVFGVPGGIDATPEALDAMLRPLPPETHWSITAIGRHQRRMLALAVLRGAGGIRVGFEDGVFLRRGVLAASNAELVSDVCELVRTLGRRVATIEEAREILACPSAIETG